MPKRIPNHLLFAWMLFESYVIREDDGVMGMGIRMEATNPLKRKRVGKDLRGLFVR